MKSIWFDILCNFVIILAGSKVLKSAG